MHTIDLDFGLQDYTLFVISSVSVELANQRLTYHINDLWSSHFNVKYMTLHLPFLKTFIYGMYYVTFAYADKPE